MGTDFYEAVESRRTFYHIGKQSTVSDERLISVVENAILHCPTAFNSQSGRVLLLLNKNHERLWALAAEALRPVVPAGDFAKTEEKLNSFSSGYGTLLFYEDQQVVQGLQSRFPLYKDNFPIWSQQASGMLQYIVWVALESEGLGVSLQHYSPLIDAPVAAEWKVPAEWKLIGQMPFGKPTSGPDEKQFLPVEDRIRIYK
ncbi:MAG: nitroreductase family protein [Clostridia bacterium]|nr:nitroreductase family protein [Clostridia bacterium]